MRQKFLLTSAALLLFAAPLVCSSVLAHEDEQAAPAAAAGAQQAPAQGGEAGQGGGARQGGGREGGARQGGGGGRQGGRAGGRQAGPPPGPAPRGPDGRALLSGATPKDMGVWTPNFGISDPIAPVATVPFKPWARALYDDRQKHELEPHTRCKASGVARQFLTPYGVEFVEMPELQRIYIFDIGGPHTYRTIFMDGRTHPNPPQPSYYGHSIGWWEGDTLVVETTGFNEDFWLDRRGLPHTEQLRTVERFTRANSTTMNYEATIDDPGAYTAPWKGAFTLRWNAGQELFEYVCQQANYAGELMVGQLGKVSRAAAIIP